MATEGQRIWQLSAGPGLRSYADLLLAYQVALVGPGDAGPWRPGRSGHGTAWCVAPRRAHLLQLANLLLGLYFGTSKDGQTVQGVLPVNRKLKGWSWNQ